MKRIFIFGFALMISVYSFGQKKIPAGFCVSTEEMRLLDFVNSIRQEYGMKPVKLSASLSFVAKTHVDDLLQNHPDTSICNLSSWSDKGKWTPCCYNAYIPNPLCMKKKPKELTPYPYYGYEMAAYFQDDYSLDSLVHMWSDTKQVLDMILTRGQWAEKKWVVAGVGINNHYVSVWFGQKPDRQRSPKICKGSSKDTKVTSVAQSPSFFYLIIASFTDGADAKEALRRTKKNGFNNAGILHAGNNYRVYLDKLTTLKGALFEKEKLPATYSDAWILKH